VANDEVVFHRGGEPIVHAGLEADTVFEQKGMSFRTLPQPGEELCRVATVNDLHFGETICGVLEGHEGGPIYRSEPGEEPYPEVMNAGVVHDIVALDPVAVIAKGDFTTSGTLEEYQRFLDVYGAAFGDRLHHVRGNHDAYSGESHGATGPFTVDVPGATLAVLDTVIPTETTGQVGADQIEWLDTVAAEADRPVMIFGHHHLWTPESERKDSFFGIRPDDSDALVDVAARRLSIVGYFAGHTHRNRVAHAAPTGSMPWAEVACVKDFPGAWAEYRIFDGGILQVFRRASTAPARAWAERTRDMFGGFYEFYALGELEDRCFLVPNRGPTTRSR
jgi:predicted phosphodiesterase